MHASAVKDEPTEPGQDLQRLGRYRLLTTLGQGGMGAIHLAVMSGTGDFRKLVVVKELRPDLATNPEFVRLFLSEAQLAGRLNHANIVQTIEAGQDGDRYFLAMEFLDGQPFHKVVQSSRVEPAVPLRFRLQVIRDVLAGLHYAHELCDYDGRPLNIAHCDVSPPNVFVTYEGHVKVVDFGIAKASGLNPTADTGVFKGKLRYAAPEQLIGENIDRRADIFSAGVMLWETITLRKFSSGSVQDHAAIERRLSGAEPRLAVSAPHVPRTLAAICDKALSVNPKDRFQTADDFREALVEYSAVYGSPYDASAISQLMGVKYAAERAQVHQLIHERLRDEEFPVATNRLEPVPAANTDGIPTAVADLSELVESIRLADGVAIRGMRRGRFKPLWWTAAAAVVGGVVVSGLVGSPDTAERSDPGDEPLPSGTLAQSVNPLKPVQAPDAHSTGDNRKDVAAATPIERTLEPVKVVAEAESKERRRKFKDEGGKSSDKGVELSDVRVSDETRATPTVSRAAVQAVTSEATTDNAARIPSAKVGEDLGEVPKRELRGLDEANPFRR